MLYICNAFSLGMLPEWRLARSSPATHIGIQPVSAEQAMAYIHEAEADGHVVFSAVGHADTARIFSPLLGRDVTVNRVSVVLSASDRYLIGQYIGPRLPDGATELPPGARIAWLVVSLEEAQ